MASVEDVNQFRQANVTLARNVEFCNVGPAREVLDQVQGLREDFKVHLSWVMKLGNVDDMFARMVVPNYLVRVLRPLSQSLRLDFLLGKVPECFLEVRGLLEQLARAVQADTRFAKEQAFATRLSKLDSSKASLSKLVEEMDGTAGSLLTDLGSSWVQTQEPLTGHAGWMSVAGGPAAYSYKDLDELTRLGRAVQKFRELQARVLEKWKNKLEKQP